jgi:hypothetical protein
MLEFMLSRLTMSLCAVIILLTLAPMVYSLPQGEDGLNSFDSLEELGSRFDEMATSPGEVKLELSIKDYLQSESDYFILCQQSLWFVNVDGRSVRSIPDGLRIFMVSGSSNMEVGEARLGWSSIVVLSKRSNLFGVNMEVYIENLDATSNTLAANISTSSRLLYM